MVLHGHVKHYKCKTIFKMWFLLGEGGFHNVFYDRPTKWPLPKKNLRNMHPQLINMELQKGIVI